MDRRGQLRNRVLITERMGDWEGDTVYGVGGTNQNTNGLLRQYFPKGSDISKLTVEAVNRVVAKINLRPRKRLD